MRLGISSPLTHADPAEWARRHKSLGLEVINFPLNCESDPALIDAYAKEAAANGLAIAEVGVWKQYLILASVLGVAEQVMKNFEKLFPKLLEQYNRQTNTIDSVTTYYILRSLNYNSESMMASAINHQNQREAAKAAAQRRSSGGGGSISFGGGGGGYGGGHGGGSR